MSIQGMLERFASSKERGAIVLHGKWGIGKTYFWRKRIIEQYLEKPWRKKYSYVSLFGIGSLAELKVAIYQATKEFDYDLRLKWWRFVHPRWLWWRAQRWLPAAIASADIPYMRDGVARSFDDVSFYFVKNRLICFDDIERRGSGLELRDVFGLISQLVDEKNCRVLVILNTDALEGADPQVWDAHKEKVFVGEIAFSPSVRELIELGLDGCQDTPWYEVVRDSLEALNVSNIRIVQRTRRFMSDVMAVVADRELRPETVSSVARVVPLLTWASSGRADGAPPLDFVMRTNPYDFGLAEEEEGASQEEKRWMQVLSDYHVYLGDRLDEALHEMIKTGYPDTEKLAAAIDHFENDAEMQANVATYKQAWKLYHDSVEDNEIAFGDSMELAWPKVSNSENVHNLQSIARIFRRLGRPSVASRFIQEWVDQRKGGRKEELSEDALGTFGMPTDSDLLKAIDAANADDAEAVMSLGEALAAMGNERVTKEAAVNAIAAATPKQIADMLVANPGPNLVPTIRHVLKLRDQSEKPNWAIAKANMREAARDLAGRSSLNEDRMRNWFQIGPVESGIERGRG